MREELARLIKKNPHLNRLQKNVYLEVIKHISDEKVMKFLEIMRTNADKISWLNDNKKRKFSLVNKQYLDEVRAIIAEGEAKMKNQAEEKLLDELEDA